MLHVVMFRQLNDHLSGKELFIRFTANAFRKLLSIYVFPFPFWFLGQDMGSDPDHCLSFYFVSVLCKVDEKSMTRDCITKSVSNYKTIPAESIETSSFPACYS